MFDLYQISFTVFFLVSTVFEESDISYWFMANSAKDQDEWSTALSSGRYVCVCLCVLQILIAYPKNVIVSYTLCVCLSSSPPPPLSLSLSLCVCVVAMSICVWHSVSCGGS